MALTHGKDAYFAVEDSAGSTLRNLSPYVSTVDFAQDVEAADVTVFGSEGRTWRPGLTAGTISVSGLWDDTADVGTQIVLQSLAGVETSVGFEYGPEGNGAGAVKLSGECVMTQYTQNVDVGDMVRFTAQFNISGSVTVGTFSA